MRDNSIISGYYWCGPSELGSLCFCTGKYLLHLIYVRCGAVQYLNVFILTLLCVQLFHSEKVTEFPPVWEKAANSAYHL